MKKAFNIIFTYILNSVLNKASADIVPPKKFKEYRFIKNLKNSSKKSVIVSLYENKNGDKIVLKKWTGRIPDAHYYNLKHEINIYKIVGEYLSSESTISFPSYVHSEEKRNSIMLVTQYFEGASLNKYKDPLKQSEIYDNCTKFIKELGNKISNEDKRKIRARSPRSYLLLYPLIFTAACYQNPKMIRIHFKSLIIFFKYSYLLRTDEKFTLIHGDMHQENIIVNKNKVRIIDLEQVMFTYPEFELATTLGSMHNSYEFSQNILARSKDLFKDNSLRSKHFTLMSIFCMTYNFTEKLKTENINSYKRLIDFVFILDDKSKSKKMALDIFS